jgi:hypothetical protein
MINYSGSLALEKLGIVNYSQQRFRTAGRLGIIKTYHSLYENLRLIPIKDRP